MAVRGKMVEVRCQCCKNRFMARAADRARGWGKFCSKSCKATRQTQRTGIGRDGLCIDSKPGDWRDEALMASTTSHGQD